jgi:hypothetical protein
LMGYSRAVPDRHDDLVDVMPFDDPIHLRGIAEISGLRLG